MKLWWNKLRCARDARSLHIIFSLSLLFAANYDFPFTFYVLFSIPIAPSPFHSHSASQFQKYISLDFKSRWDVCSLSLSRLFCCSRDCYGCIWTRRNCVLAILISHSRLFLPILFEENREKMLPDFHSAAVMMLALFFPLFFFFFVVSPVGNGC